MTFYFYDLETTGFNSKQGRIMQFAGQRTDESLIPIGEPHNILIKITPDIIPDPDAVLVTGITPQKTIAEGITEREFLEIFHNEISIPDTTFVGYNIIRFDDEFIRNMNYRNFYDAYEWQWQDGRSRWDLLDVVRMTRALRPEGIKWPFDSEGKPSNRLELVASINRIEHTSAHDALSDVSATIAVAKLIRESNPKLFDFLLKMRSKKLIADFVENNDMFVYTSGKYPSEFEKTTIVSNVIPHPDRQAVIVYDLRHDPKQYSNMSATELIEAWKRRKSEEGIILPVKTLQFNRCPAIAPVSVIDKKSEIRLKIDLKQIEQNLTELNKLTEFKNNLSEALKIMQKQQQEQIFPDQNDVDSQLYNGFINPADKPILQKIRTSSPDSLDQYISLLKDNRLRNLLPLYKARNFPKQLSSDDYVQWNNYRERKLLDGGENSKLAKYFKRIDELHSQTTNKESLYILEELKLYGESIMQ